MNLTKHGYPRRRDITELTPLEQKLRDAMLAVEAEGAHPFLTDASTFIQKARESVADWVELPCNENLWDTLLRAYNERDDALFDQTMNALRQGNQ